MHQGSSGLAGELENCEALPLSRGHPYYTNTGRAVVFPALLATDGFGGGAGLDRGAESADGTLSRADGSVAASRRPLRCGRPTSGRPLRLPHR